MSTNLDNFLDDVRKRYDVLIENKVKEFIDFMNFIGVEDIELSFIHGPKGDTKVYYNDIIILHFKVPIIEGTDVVLKYDLLWKNKEKEIVMSGDKNNDGDTILTTYIKDKKGLVAVMVAVRPNDDSYVYFGWAKYHRTKEKKAFNKKRGRSIAIERAKKNKVYTMPYIIDANLDNFIERATKYFQDCSLIKPYGR